MFALVPTKLPHYVLPAYPALAFLAALWLTGEAAETRGGKVLRIAAGAFSSRSAPPRWPRR